jgi:hypothetical protein
VYQIGYFDGLASGTDPASLGGALWDSFIAISGDGSLNSGLVTTMGDTDLGPAPDSFVFQKTTFGHHPRTHPASRLSQPSWDQVLQQHHGGEFDPFDHRDGLRVQLAALCSG